MSRSQKPKTRVRLRPAKGDSPQKRGAATRARNRAAALKQNETVPALTPLERMQEDLDILTKNVAMLLRERTQVEKPMTFAHTPERGWEPVSGPFGDTEVAPTVGGVMPGKTTASYMAGLHSRLESLVVRAQRMDERLDTGIYQLFGISLGNDDKDHVVPEPFGHLEKFSLMLTVMTRTFDRIEESLTRLEDKL